MAGILAIGLVVLLDLVLSGDNAVIVGTLAASLPQEQRRTAIAWGVGLAVILRILLSLVAVTLLHLPGVLLFGGCLLLWVSWKMWRDLRDDGSINDSLETNAPRSFWAGIAAIAAADVSMSLDNVLAVAGAARDHMVALVFGLVFSVVLMGVGAAIVAKMIGRYRWIAWAGLGLILVIAVRMLWEGYNQLVAIV